MTRHRTTARRSRTSWRRPDDRVEVIVHPVNQGHIATYNEGLLDWADGDYCVLISADDMLTPGALHRAADLLDAHPEVGFVYGKVVRFRDGEKLRPARTTSRPPTIWPGHRWLEQRFKDAHTCVFSPEVVMRTSVQHQVGGYNPDLYHTSDVEMWMSWLRAPMWDSSTRTRRTSARTPT